MGSLMGFFRSQIEAALLLTIARRAPAYRRDRFKRIGLRSIREQWWWQTRFETPAMVWRHIWQLEQTPEPRAGGCLAGDPTSIAVYMPGHIGDLLLTVPMLQALRARFPLAHLEWMVGPWVASLARRYPVADLVTEFSPAWFQFRRGADGPGCRTQVEWARQHQPVDVFISTSATDLATLFVGRACRPAWWIARSAGTDLYPVAAQQTMVMPGRDRYEAHDLLHLVQPLGIVPGPARATYTVRPVEYEEARRLLAAAMGDPVAPYVVIAPSAGWPGKQWPVERWASVADKLICRGLSVVLVGGPADVQMAENLRAAMKEKAFSLVGRTSLIQLAAVIEGAALWMGSDSGGMHVAAAVGTPTVSLFGPTHPAKWAPPGPGNLVLKADHDCSGCVAWHPRAPCLQEGACMKKISEAAVVAAAVRQVEAMREPVTD